MRKKTLDPRPFELVEPLKWQIPKQWKFNPTRKVFEGSRAKRDVMNLLEPIRRSELFLEFTKIRDIASAETFLHQFGAPIGNSGFSRTSVEHIYADELIGAAASTRWIAELIGAIHDAESNTHKQQIGMGALRKWLDSDSHPVADTLKHFLTQELQPTLENDAERSEYKALASLFPQQLLNKIRSTPVEKQTEIESLLFAAYKRLSDSASDDTYRVKFKDKQRELYISCPPLPSAWQLAGDFSPSLIYPKSAWTLNPDSYLIWAARSFVAKVLELNSVGVQERFVWVRKNSTSGQFEQISEVQVQTPWQAINIELSELLKEKSSLQRCPNPNCRELYGGKGSGKGRGIGRVCPKWSCKKWATENLGKINKNYPSSRERRS